MLNPQLDHEFIFLPARVSSHPLAIQQTLTKLAIGSASKGDAFFPSVVFCDQYLLPQFRIGMLDRDGHRFRNWPN